MAKRTAIIDIGSNSARMAIYEKDSRYSFFLVHEVKSRVRISEGVYENNGVLQQPAIKRASATLCEFAKIAKNFSCRKILCVATSALRDASNKNAFIKDIKNQFGINIRVIDGNEEAMYGAIAVNNMVSGFTEATTIDIGGGSTELAKIKNGVITHTISLNLGTIRLKELFFDKKAPKEKIINFINNEIKKVGKEFHSKDIIGIGGTIRALSKFFMEKSSYPINTIHNYEYNINTFLPQIMQIGSSKITELKSLGIKKDRIDTIREGSVIFEALVEKLGSKKVITSGVGVREGLYLSNVLRQIHNRFPSNFYLSLESLKHRFAKDDKISNQIAKCAHDLFDVLLPIHQIDEFYKFELQTACKLHSIGKVLNFYQDNIHSMYFVLNSLNYGFTHKQKALISMILVYNNKKITDVDIKKFKELLPEVSVINWLIFILSLSKILYIDGDRSSIKFRYKNHTLYIETRASMYLARDLIKKLSKPSAFAIKFEEIL